MKRLSHIRAWSTTVSRYFGEYQVESPALAADAVYAVGRPQSSSSRTFLVLSAVALIGVPLIVLMTGVDAMGNRYAFGTALVIWPFLMSAYGSPYRAKIFGGTEPSPDERSLPPFVFVYSVLFVTVAFPVVLRVVLAHHHSTLAEIARGLLLGIAVACAFEATRDAVTTVIAGRGGEPIYPRRPGREWDPRPAQLWPQIDPLAAERTFKTEFKASADLLAMAWACKPSSADGDAAKALLLAIFARSTLTYRAVIQLCRSGYGEQADMLNRSLFEDMAAAHWVSLHPAEAVERIEKHHQHSRVLWNRVLERRPGLGDAVDLGLDQATVDDLDATFGKNGTRPWLGVGMWDLVLEIEQLWEDDAGKEQLWVFYELAHCANNQKHHLSSFALNRIVRTQEADGELIFRYSASPSIAADGPVGPALFGALWIYWQLAGLIWDVWNIPQNELNALMEPHIEALRVRSAEWRRLIAAGEQRLPS